jgi:hypothetical protein
VSEEKDPMTERTTLVDLENGVLLRLIAVAMEKVQRRRHRPKKQGRLHRV